jgi:hypothetical protein
VYKHWLFGFLFLWGFLSASAFLQAQEASFCLVQLDKPFYVNGEVLWYKIYFPESFQGKSAAVKVKLLDSRGKTIHQVFHRMEKEPFVHGYYKIPFDIEPGRYQLFFLGTRRDEKAAQILAKAPVPIYNDNPIYLRNIEVAEGNFDPAPPLTGGELRVAVTMDRDTVRSREEVRVAVSVRDDAGRPVQAGLSVAVTDRALVEGAIPGGQVIHRGPGLPDGIAGQLEATLFTRARLTDVDGKPLKANVLGAYSSQENQIYYTTAGEQGAVFLELPDFAGRKKLQFLGFYKEEENIRIEPVDDALPVDDAPLVFTPAILEYLELSNQRKKVFQHYTALEFNIEPALSETGRRELKPDLRLNVQDYEPFGNLATFFREVLTPLRFRLRRDSTYEAVMLNPRAHDIENEYPGDPLFIIDGKATRNADFIGKMAPDQVQTIDLYFYQERMRSLFNVFGYSGVAVITTTIPDIEIPADDATDILTVSGLQPPAAFPVFHPDQVGQDAHRPFFRPQLYWNPALTTDKNGEVTFTFYQSDDASTFQIIVVAQGEGGARGFGERMYEAAW